jgi:hypothetical protein
MIIYPLSTKQSDDLPDVLIHMTGRKGKINDRVATDILALSPFERLTSILASRSFRAAPSFDNTWPLVCFSQTTKRALSKLIGLRYAPAGIAIHKQAIFDHNGGPAFYVRGDEYDAFRAALPPQLAARAVRYWPGSAQDETFSIWPYRSEWMHEREWRLPAPVQESWSWQLPEESVAFIILGDDLVEPFSTWAQNSGDSWIQGLPIATWHSTSGEFDYSGTNWV